MSLILFNKVCLYDSDTDETSLYGEYNNNMNFYYDGSHASTGRYAIFILL